MKKCAYLLVAIVCAITSSCVGRSDIDDLQNQIDALQKNQIATVQEQISSISNTITSLEQVDAELRNQIADLKDKDSGLAQQLAQKEEALSKRISELKTYVEEQLKAAKDWAEATFSTLEQYQQTVSSLAALEQSIKDLKTELSEAISKAISDSETSMKAWVNDQLSGYWTCAELESKLRALQEEFTKNDDAQQKQIDSLSQVLEESVSSLTEAYQVAIASAIKDSEGRISEKIAKDIAAANKVLEDRITKLEGRVKDLEDWKEKVNAQIEDLISRVQSINVVPQYSDGSVDIHNCLSESEIDIEISPSSVAEKLVEQGASVFSMAAVYTETKAVSFIDIPVKRVSYDNGVVTLSVDGSVLSKSFLSGSQTASARIAVSAGKTDIKSEYFSIQVYYDMMDLGLSVKWAMCNLGASAPEEYGLYYQWGDTEGYGSDTSDGKPFSWGDYKWCVGTANSFNSLTKYNSWTIYGDVDNLTVLETVDDAASAALGGSWRMPTAEECQELINKCTWTWTTLNGINGFKVQSTVDGYTDNWIFLPAAGWRLANSFYGENAGLNYWSKSIGSSPSYAISIINSDDQLDVYRKEDTTSRCNGFSIRPVCD